MGVAGLLVGRLLRWPLYGLAAAMILRAVLQAIGDVQRLAHGVSPAAAYTATWDLVLWSPFFLVWGDCWAWAAWLATPRAPGGVAAAEAGEAAYQHR